ncbi:hypothetical protein J6590_052774 [Homalodisca vitripennis]|nr:hypothetical protein J6590_052774 [Homalodisca vitripennis]
METLIFNYVFFYINKHNPSAFLSPPTRVSGIADPEKTKDPKYNLPRFVWDSVGLVKSLPSPRIIKTHLPYHLLPLQLQQGRTGAKIVYVTRDVKDVVLSYHHHCQLQGLCRADFDTFATLFINDAITWTPYWENLLSYLKREDDKKILFLRYEDMKKNLSSEIKRVSEFLGKQLTVNQVEILCKHLSFDNMKSNPAVNFEERREIIKKLTEKEMNGNVMREGRAGDWKKKLSPDWVVRIDQWTDNKLQGSSILNRVNVE